MTGVDIWNLARQEYDLDYTDFLDATKANRWFYKAFINVLEEIYSTKLIEQKAFDDLDYLIAVDKTFTVNSATNTIYLGTTSIAISGITFSTTTSTITTTYPHDLITGMQVALSGIVSTGTLAATLNGNTYVVTVTGANTFTVSTAPTTPTGTYTSGGIATPTPAITDYYHYLYARVRFTYLTPYTVTNSTFSTPITITLNKRTTFRNGDQVTIAGIGGNTNANGTFYLKQSNEFQYQLYTDIRLNTPVAGNGTQTGTGTISQIYYSPIKFKRSDEKGSIFGNPTIQNPYFQMGERFLRVLPINQPCDQITIDYIRNIPKLIDVTDAVTDYLNWYTESLIYKIISRVGVLLAGADRDIPLLSIENSEERSA